MSGDQKVVSAIRLKAMNFMARREFSRKELESRLTDLFSVHPKPISEVLDKLESEGLLCDERFAECFIASSIRKGRGPQRIRRELIDRGINESMANEKLAQPEIDWFALAQDVFGKKFGHPSNGDLSVSESLKSKARQSRFMQYRGFDFDQIKHCLDESGV